VLERGREGGSVKGRRRKKGDTAEGGTIVKRLAMLRDGNYVGKLPNGREISVISVISVISFLTVWSLTTYLLL
jgi:hypothetical protein